MKKTLCIGIVSLVTLTLAGCSHSTSKTVAKNTASTNTVSAHYEPVSLGHDGVQLVPETTRLKAGTDYELTITPNTNGKGCMSTIKMDGVDSSPKAIIEGEPIVYHLNNLEPGEYELVCNGMGMRQGSIIIE